MNKNERPETTESTRSQSPTQAPFTKSVRLSREKAARWLILLSQLSSWEATASTGITKLRDQLENDCWLARWKREEVLYEVCPTVIADVSIELMQIAQGDISAHNADVLMEIVQDLSSGCLDDSEQI